MPLFTACAHLVLTAGGLRAPQPAAAPAGAEEEALPRLRLDRAPSRAFDDRLLSDFGPSRLFGRLLVEE
ncbi:hypothetical protein [Azospirillum sp.]|uniref:hypothetical protein n=1 Tax=Azospirillum sp. TaxID=34012 RepID=UPI00260BE6C0|nr:hypothetical protein [Azospirillum sp.]